jgi:hypothetical protein
MPHAVTPSSARARRARPPKIASISSIDLTVTSGIAHLRRREKTFAEV